jgi:hypothetical protein
MSGYRARYIKPVEDSMTKFRRMEKRRAWIPSCFYLRPRVSLNAGSWVHVSSNSERLTAIPQKSQPIVLYGFIVL